MGLCRGLLYICIYIFIDCIYTYTSGVIYICITPEVTCDHTACKLDISTTQWACCILWAQSSLPQAQEAQEGAHQGSKRKVSKGLGSKTQDTACMTSSTSRSVWLAGPAGSNAHQHHLLTQPSPVHCLTLQVLLGATPTSFTPTRRPAHPKLL